jgi:hypothetical protein
MKRNFWSGIVLVLVSATSLLISFWPVSMHTDKIIFSSSDGITGTLLVSQPDQVPVGDKFTISLKISVDQKSVDDQLTLISKLEMDNLKVTPYGEGKVSINTSNPVVLNWQIQPTIASAFSGTLWLFFETANGTRDLILAKPVELKTTTLFGLSLRTIRMVSIIGLIVGFVYLFIKKFKKATLISVQSNVDEIGM